VHLRSNLSRKNSHGLNTADVRVYVSSLMPCPEAVILPELLVFSEPELERDFAAVNASLKDRLVDLLDELHIIRRMNVLSVAYTYTVQFDVHATACFHVGCILSKDPLPHACSAFNLACLVRLRLSSWSCIRLHIDKHDTALQWA